MSIFIEIVNTIVTEIVNNKVKFFIHELEKLKSF